MSGAVHPVDAGASVPAGAVTGVPVDAGASAASPAELLAESPVALLAVDLNGVVLAANGAMRRWIGGSGGGPGAGSESDAEPGSDAARPVRGRNLVEWLTPAARLLYETRIVPQLVETGSARDIVLELRDDRGARRSALCNAELRTDAEGRRIVRIAAFDAGARIAFERELLGARREAELAHERLAVLHSATSALAVATGLDDLGAALVAAAARVTAASWTRVALVDHEQPASGSGQRSWGSAPTEEAQLATIRSTPEQLVCHDPAELVAAAREADDPAAAERLARAGVEALVITPIVQEGAPGRVVFGEIRCWFRRPRALDGHELETLRSIAAQAERVLEHLQLQDQLRHRALHDGLTGLPNRALLTERLDRALGEAQRTGEGCAVLFLDLDGFKAINDGAGHQAGDEVLRSVAARLRADSRRTDTVSRLGGDEFVVVAGGVSEDAALELAGRICATTRAPLEGGAAGWPLSSSVGVVHWDPLRPLDDGRVPGGQAPSAPELLAAADAAMYAAKRGGKDAVVLRRWPLG